MLFKVGSKEAIGSSTNSTMLSRSVTMRVELGPGNYVVQVRHTVDTRFIMLIYTLHQVRLDREINGEQVRRSPSRTHWLAFSIVDSLRSLTRRKSWPRRCRNETTIK
jgi:hypothetical protein